MPLLRAKDPQALFTTEARTSQINCVAARPPRLRGGTLSARVSNRFFTGGRAADERGSGRVTSYAITDGTLCTTAAVDKPVQCLAVVETVMDFAGPVLGDRKGEGMVHRVKEGAPEPPATACPSRMS